VTVWCWVKSLATGHRFDIPLERLDHLEAIGAVQEIPGRRRRAHSARNPKPLIPLGGRGHAGNPASRPAETEE